MTKVTIEKVLRSGPLVGGHIVVIDLQLSNGDELTLEINHEKLPFLAMAINDAGVVAERARKTLPGQPVETVVPYRGIGVRTGTSVDNRFVVVVFQTDMGTPVQIAMTPDLARETIERLSTALDQIGRQSPPVRS